MKRLLLLLCAFLTIGARAATLSGTLTNASFGSSSLSGYKVYLMDSTSTSGYFAVDSVVTGSAGTYTLTIPSSISWRYIYVRTTACGKLHQAGSYYGGAAAVTLNLTICPLISGSAWVVDTIRNSVTNAPVYRQKVYLLDSTATTFHKDSAFTDHSGVVWIPIPSTVAPGNLRIYTVAPCGTQSQTIAYNWLNVTAPTMLVCSSSPVVSGTITNLSTSAPVPYYNVFVTDSFGGALVRFDSVTTNPSGVFSVQLPVTLNGHTITAAAQGCGSKVTNNTSYAGGNITLNLGICATSTATISGVVSHAGTWAVVSGHKVYLLDSSSPTNVYRDSAVTASNGSYSFTIPPSITTGNFWIQSQSCGSLQTLVWIGYNGYSGVRNLAIYPAAAPTFSGTIYNLNGSPAPGISVVVHQVVSPWSSISTVASASGTYSVTIPCNWPPSGNLRMGAGGSSCGARNNVIVPFTGSNIVENDTICSSNPYSISGVVRKQGGGIAANAKVYAILKYYDSVAMATTLKAFDSTISSSVGRYYFGRSAVITGYVPGLGVDRGILVKAALQSSDPAYASFLPTYLDSSLNWNTGRLTSWYYDWNMRNDSMHIIMRSGSNPGGPGFIGGNVMLGANKSSAVGDPLASRILILTNLADKPVACAYSDAAGRFRFPSLPYGSYYLFGDAGGRANPKLQITLSAGTPSISNVIFDENSTSFEGRFANVGVGPDLMEQSLRVYPNPAGNQLSIAGSKEIPGRKTLSIRTVNGALVSRMEIDNGQEAQATVTTLPAGMYLVELRTESGVHNLRFVKK